MHLAVPPEKAQRQGRLGCSKSGKSRKPNQTEKAQSPTMKHFQNRKQHPPGAQIEKTKVSAKKDGSKTKNKGNEPASKVGDHEDTPNAGVDKALADAQGKARAEAKKPDAMWAQISKAVDSAIAADAQGEIKQHQVDYILNAIMACALPKLQAEVSGNNLASFPALNQATTIITTNVKQPSRTKKIARLFGLMQANVGREGGSSK